MTDKTNQSLFRSVLRGGATLGAGAGIAQLIGIAATPFIARFYSASDFGMFAIYFFGVQLFGQVLSGRYEQAIMVARTSQEAGALVELSIYISTSATIVTAILMAFFGSMLDQWMGTNFGLAWPLMPLAALPVCFWQIYCMLAIRGGRFGSVSMSRFVKISTTILAQMGIGLALLWGQWGLIVGEVLGGLVACLALMLQLRRRWHPSATALAGVRNRRGLQRALVLVRRYKDFPLHNLPHILSNQVAAWLTLSLIFALNSAVDAGYYFMMQRIVMLPAALVGTAISQAYFPAAAASMQTNGRFDYLLRRTAGPLAILGVAIALFLILEGEWAFVLAFGENWREAGRLAGIFAPFVAIHLVLSTLAPTPIVANRVFTTFLLGLTQNIIFVAAFWAGSVIGGDLESGMKCAIYISIPYMLGVLLWYHAISHGQKTERDVDNVSARSI